MCARSRPSKPALIGSRQQRSPAQLLWRYRMLAGELETMMYEVETQLDHDGYSVTLARARAIRLAVFHELEKWSELAESLLPSLWLSWLTRLADSRDSTTASPE